MARYNQGDNVTYLCGQAPQAATIAQDVLPGDLDAWIDLNGAEQKVSIACISPQGGFAAAAVGDDVFLHNHDKGFLWHGHVQHVTEGLLTVSLDGLAGQTLVLPAASTTQGRYSAAG